MSLPIVSSGRAELRPGLDKLEAEARRPAERQPKSESPATEWRAGAGSPQRVFARIESLPSEREDLRAYALDRETGSVKQVDVHEQLARAPQPKRRPLERRTVDSDVRKLAAAASAARRAQLGDLRAAPSAGTLLPEDNTLKPHTAHLTVVTDVDATFVRTMARVGVLEGFAVRVAGSESTTRALLDPQAQANVQFVARGGRTDAWTEDNGEIDARGMVSIPARMESWSPASVKRDRVLRGTPGLTPDQREAVKSMDLRSLEKNYPEFAFGIQGGVARNESYDAKVAMAAALRAPLRESLTYLEGGNVIGGTRPDGSPYALVGKDSLALSRDLLARDLGRAPTDDELTMAVAKDLGLTPGQVVPVEQAGAFHIDMSMKPLGPGHVLLNDSRLAFQQLGAFLRADHAAKQPSAQSPVPMRTAWAQRGAELELRLRSLEQVAERTAASEERAANDLSAAGLTVSRVAGRYLDLDTQGARDAFNFINAESGTARDGATFMVTQGGPKALEQSFALALAKHSDAPTRLYFGDRAGSQKSLADQGGTGCRVKFTGDRLSPAGAARQR